MGHPDPKLDGHGEVADGIEQEVRAFQRRDRLVEEGDFEAGGARANHQQQAAGWAVAADGAGQVHEPRQLNGAAEDPEVWIGRARPLLGLFRHDGANRKAGVAGENAFAAAQDFGVPAYGDDAERSTVEMTVAQGGRLFKFENLFVFHLGSPLQFGMRGFGGESRSHSFTRIPYAALLPL